MAASIIRNDIRLTVYDLGEYQTLEGTENGDTMTPGSLKRFLCILLDPNGQNATISNRRCTAIAH